MRVERLERRLVHRAECLDEARRASPAETRRRRPRGGCRRGDASKPERGRRAAEPMRRRRKSSRSRNAGRVPHLHKQIRNGLAVDPAQPPQARTARASPPASKGKRNRGGICRRRPDPWRQGPGKARSSLSPRPPRRGARHQEDRLSDDGRDADFGEPRPARLRHIGRERDDARFSLPGKRLHARRRLEPIHARHVEIHQHNVKCARSSTISIAASSILGKLRVMAEAPKHGRGDVPIEGVVIHDEDAERLERRKPA